VTLLIGVNNQYRGRSVESYKVDFEKMLQRAIAFARGNKSRVIVLSIPDWGITPFATQKGVDPIQVAKGIDEYNQTKKEICEKHGIQFIDITVDQLKVWWRINFILPNLSTNSGQGNCSPNSKK
jgi:phospholipase/lecithinase/hemolysin